MSVAEILHQIEALPTEERLELMNKFFESNDAELPAFPPPILSEIERVKLEESLRQQPNLEAELAEKIERMQAGHSIDLDELKILLHLANK